MELKVMLCRVVPLKLLLIGVAIAVFLAFGIGVTSVFGQDLQSTLDRQAAVQGGGCPSREVVWAEGYPEPPRELHEHDPVAMFTVVEGADASWRIHWFVDRVPKPEAIDSQLYVDTFVCSTHPDRATYTVIYTDPDGCQYRKDHTVWLIDYAIYTPFVQVGD
jgi:hypothetical protein